MQMAVRLLPLESSGESIFERRRFVRGERFEHASTQIRTKLMRVNNPVDLSRFNRREPIGP